MVVLFSSIFSIFRYFGGKAQNCLNPDAQRKIMPQKTSLRFFFLISSEFICICLDNPRASYRAENPTNPKIGQNYQPDIQIPPTAGDRKNTPKIPEKYPENTNFVIFEYSKGYLKGYFGESHVLYVGGYFCTSLAFLVCSWSRGCQHLPRLNGLTFVVLC